MATAVIHGVRRPILVPQKPRVVSNFSSNLSTGKAFSRVEDLTIHRITKTHHGRTLLMLGHAAEHLAESRRYSIGVGGRVERASHAEAIHILMGLSREVFEEFADLRPMHQRVQNWVVERAAGVLEKAGRLIIRRRVRG